MPDKVKVRVVFAQVRAPQESDGSDGQVVEGRYIVEETADGWVVTLTDKAGKPVRDHLGRTYSHKLKENDSASAHAWAQRLSKQFRLVLLGKDATAAATKLKYPKIGYA